MSNPSYTPGPWQVGMSSGSNGNMIYQLGGDVMSPAIAQVYGLWANATVSALREDERMREGVANALLIAAAPELLEALEAIIGACDACEGRDDLSLTDVFTEEMEQAARAAIAKAKGEPS